MELNAKGRPILPLKLYDGDDVIVDIKELLAWQRSSIRQIERLRAKTDANICCPECGFVGPAKDWEISVTEADDG